MKGKKLNAKLFTLRVQNTLMKNGESGGDIDVDVAVQCHAVPFSTVQKG